MKNTVRVTLRLPVSLHKRMAEIADSEGMSLNQTIVLNLSNCLQCYSIVPHTGRDRQFTNTCDHCHSELTK